MVNVTLTFSSVYVVLVTLTIHLIIEVRCEVISVEDVVMKWAPLIWLAPEEKYFPLSIEEFLSNVYPGFEHGKPLEIQKKSKDELLPSGRESESLYLITKKEIGSLQNETSFLNGINPINSTVPIYATVTRCYPTSSQPRWNEKSKNDVYNFEIDSRLFFHVTYWMFYPYNEGKDVCFIGKVPAPFIFNTCLGHRRTIGNHIGDWEHVSMFFNGKNYPEEMYVSTHDSGVYYKYEHRSRLFKYNRQVVRKMIAARPQFPPIVRTTTGRPVLFAALGSHGLWSAPGDHYYVNAFRLHDKTGYGVPWKTWNNINIYTMGVDAPPSWTTYNGKWGNPKSNCFLFRKLGICEYFDGPAGLATRKQNFQCGVKQDINYPRKVAK